MSLARGDIYQQCDREFGDDVMQQAIEAAGNRGAASRTIRNRYGRDELNQRRPQQLRSASLPRACRNPGRTGYVLYRGV